MNSGHIPVCRHGLPHVEMYEVTADELDRIEQEGTNIGIDFQIGSLCLTFGVSFLIALIFSPPPEAARKTFDVFAVLTALGILLGVIFLVKWFRGREAFSRTLRKIRERQIGPIGDDTAGLFKATEAVISAAEVDAGPEEK